MKKKRVLHLLSSNSFSGAENVVCTIIENDKDYEMYYCSKPGPIVKILKDKKINYLPIKKLSPKLIKEVCVDNQIDILHAHDYKASFWAALSGFKGKIIAHVHCNPEFSHNWNLFTLAYKMVMNRFDNIIFVSNEAKNQAIYLRNRVVKTMVIENVVNKKSVIEKSKAFKTGKYHIIFVGRLTEVKRPELVIEVTRKLKETYPQIKTAIVGDGNLNEKLRELIKSYELEDNVELLGFKPNPFPYVKNSKVALLTSSHEGLPMSVIECMALDVPVLNSGVGGLSTLFNNHQEFICTSVKDYCDKIEKILNGDVTFKSECTSIIKDATNVSKFITEINSVYK